MIRLPCSIISLDLQDIMGSHTVNIHGSLMKYKLNKEGEIIGESVYKTKPPGEIQEDESDEEMPDYEEVKKHFSDQEGCQLKGYFLVNKVKFHLNYLIKKGPRKFPYFCPRLWTNNSKNGSRRNLKF